MAEVLAQHPTTGEVSDTLDVTMDSSGMLYIITSQETQTGIIIHRYAWEGVVKMVGMLEAAAKERAERWVLEHQDDKD